MDLSGEAFLRCLIAIPLAVLAVPALGASTTSQPDPVGESARVPDEDLTRHGDEILVIAARIKGQVDAPQPAVTTFTEEDIQAYGVASINDLIAMIAPEIGSGRGRGGGQPLFLLNGQRISSFRELRDIPPEAIRRLEVLPEEVALRYGYPPNQRIVNIILKDRFRSKSMLAENFWSLHGGTSSPGIQGTVANFDGPRRSSLTARYNGVTLLTEADRQVRQSTSLLATAPGDPDPAQARSLIASYQEYALNGNWSRGLGEKGAGGSLSFNTAFTHTDSTAFSGLNTVVLTDPNGVSALRTFGAPLQRLTKTDTLQAGSALNKALGKWQFSATVDSSYAESDIRIDRRASAVALGSLISAAAAGTLPISGPLPALPAAGSDDARERDISVTSLATLTGSPMHMPAGDVSLTAKAGYAYANTRSSDTRTALPQVTLDRGDASLGVNLAVPLTSRRNHVLGAMGDITLNLSLGYDRLSDFGSLTDWSAGLTWNLTGKFGLQASYIVNEAAPSLAQLGAPNAITLNVPIYDFATGQTVSVSLVGGGNRALTQERRHDIKLGANWQLPFLARSNLIVEYFRNHSSDVAIAFPLLTPAIEAAFPGRVLRGVNGQLLQIDQRPITISGQEESRLRWGFNLTGTLGHPSIGPAGGNGGRGGMGGFGALGGGQRATGGRWNFSIYHTHQFSDVVTVAPGGPVLDLLNGDALSSGGVARESVTFEGGGFYHGFGLRLNGNWGSPTHLSAGNAGVGALRFGSVFDVDARLFVEFDMQAKLLKQMPFLKGSRLSIRMTNILDSRQRVTDATGVVPLAYQADYLDPRGRTVGIDFRKVF